MSALHARGALSFGISECRSGKCLASVRAAHTFAVNLSERRECGYISTKTVFPAGRTRSNPHSSCSTPSVPAFGGTARPSTTWSASMEPVLATLTLYEMGATVAVSPVTKLSANVVAAVSTSANGVQRQGRLVPKPSCSRRWCKTDRSRMERLLCRCKNGASGPVGGHASNARLA